MECARWSLTRNDGPDAEPLTVAEVKAALRIDHDHEDGLLSSLIVTAREYVESVTCRQLILATYNLYIDSFPPVIVLPRPPVTAVSLIVYYDAANTLRSLSAPSQFEYSGLDEPCSIVPVYGFSWPATYPRQYAVIVTYTAGYGASGASVPEPIRRAMLLLIGHWYEHREEVVDGGTVARMDVAADALLAPYRMLQV